MIRCKQKGPHQQVRFGSPYLSCLLPWDSLPCPEPSAQSSHKRGHAPGITPVLTQPTRAKTVTGLPGVVPSVKPWRPHPINAPRLHSMSSGNLQIFTRCHFPPRETAPGLGKMTIRLVSTSCVSTVTCVQTQHGSRYGGAHVPPQLWEGWGWEWRQTDPWGLSVTHSS